MSDDLRPSQAPQTSTAEGWLSDRITSVDAGLRSVTSLDGPPLAPAHTSPYIRLQFVNVYVRDQERSLRFFVDRLGFTLLLDVRFASGNRWIQVAPPHGTASLALILPRPELGEESLVGHSAPVTFLTEDMEGTYRKWSGQGIRFSMPPQNPSWGGTFCRFEDPDGNPFVLVGFDEATREIEDQRRALAKRQEAERRAAQELEIARQVQSRLFPQQKPAFPSLDYDGACIQARAVGGDYFDFLNLAGDRLGLVVGDIAGKGMPAALLMANLQAAIRSQAVAASLRLDHFLSGVNRLLFQNTETAAYATLFFAELNPAAGQIRYVNCGHVPAFLLRAGGALERLPPTGTVLGLFEDWDGAIDATPFATGDVLALCTDGITEAAGQNGIEFADEGLADALRRGAGRSACDLVRSITNEVLRFSGQERHDDITLIVARSIPTAA
jgi:serine phosphatase RsbU (regulator of sigma subunit)/uncharacterized glyoxalase superfamily protein PhnB